MKISVLNWCFSRQEQLDFTLPNWLKQEGVDYEIVIGHGPGIKLPNDPRIVPVFTDQDPSKPLKLSTAYNQILRASHGDVLLYTQCDMQVNSPTQLKRMLDLWMPNRIVCEKFFKRGKRDAGIYLQFAMVGREATEKIGGMCEEYDTQGCVSHSDGDFIACLLENDLEFEWLESDEEHGGGVYHLDHESPNWTSPEIAPKVAKGEQLYHSRHGEGIMSLWARQLMKKNIPAFGRR